MQLSHTEQSGLTLKKVEGFNGTLNKHACADGVTVGPSYPTKAEALADTADYAQRAGWMK